MLAMIHALPLAKKDSYLDFGCGSGYGTELLALYFKHSIGVDENDDVLAYAIKNHRRSGAHFVKSLPPSYTFDFITCIEVIEHMTVTPAEALLDRFRKLLDPEGTLVLTTPIYDPQATPNPHHAKEYTMSEFEVMLRKFFGIVEVQDISMGLPNMIAICREPLP